ncbi:MAG: hypothetical protein AB7F96_05270 [Beijerinckiaceae bacterium]
MRDTLHNNKYVPVLAPVVIGDNTATTGAWIDRLGYEGLTFAVQTGILADADATFAVTMQEANADDQSDAASVDDANMISMTDGVAPEAAAGFDYADDGAVKKIGYIGHKRYVRVTITPANNAGSAPVAILAHLSHASTRPVAA